jgi:glycosyltransferase involved in cell wall biosynthesis
MLRSEQALWMRLERRAYQQAAVIFTRSEYAARSVRDDYGIDPGKIVVAHAGVNIPLPDVDSLSRQREPRALFIGSDFLRKGGDIVLAAWPRVLERLPEARLTIIGDPVGPLPQGVDVLGGRWDPSRVIRELQRAQLFVMPSRCETWGDVFLEAMAHGVPCVGSANDAIPEIIQDGFTGYIVADEDVAGLADRMSALLANPGLAAHLGLAGRRRVEERFTWQEIIGRMLPTLQAVSDRTVSVRSR